MLRFGLRLRARGTANVGLAAGDLDVVAEVDEEIIAEVLSTATGIPVFKLTEEESAREREKAAQVVADGQDGKLKVVNGLLLSADVGH